MWNITINTFRELVRSRIFAMVLVFASMLIVFSLVLASLSLGQSSRIVLDFGVAMIELSALVSVVFIGGQMLFKEIEGRTIYLILSKPIQRGGFLLGKFFGFGLVLGIIIGAEFLCLLGLLAFEWIAITPMLFVAMGCIYLKLLTLFALVLFFSTFSSSILSIIFGLSLYIASHSVQMVVDLAIRSKSGPLLYLGQGLLVALPNFEALSYPKTILASELTLPWTTGILSITHALLYTGVILSLAVFAFSRKNFENA